MKKFLFTLLTLFMASSAFAEGGNYLTMNDYTVVKTKLETKQVSVGVKAHFDNYVSAMQVWVEVPEGVTLRGASAGNDYGISYMDNMGMDKVATPEITFKDGKFVIASMAAAYGDDGDTFYGVAKWAPGDYANYLNFVFRCNADFKGGDVKIIAAPACGDDTRPEVVANRADGTSYTTTSALSVEYIAPEPVLTWDENNYSMTAALPEGYNAADYEIVMMANGVEVQNPYTVDQTSEDQTIEFTAYTKHAADETYDSNDATYGKETKQTVTVPAKVVEQTAKPNIAQENVEGGVKVTATGEGTVKLYVDGVEVDNPYVIAQTDVEKTYTVTATAQEEGKTISETATLEVTVPAKPAQTDKPVITPEETEDAVIVTATGNGTVVMYVNGVEVENPVTFAKEEVEKTYTVTATAQEEGKLISETATLEVTVPAKQPVGPVETKTFVKVTSAAQLVAGKNYIFVCGDYAMGAQATGNFLLPIAITGGDEVEVGTDVAIMTLGGSAGKWTLALGDQYLTAGNSSNLGFGSNATEWVITNNEGALAGFRAKHAEHSRAIRKHNSMDRFGNYSTSDVNSEFAWIYVEKTDEPVLENLTGNITIGDPDVNGHVTVAYKGDEDVTLTVKVKDADGKEVEFTFEDGVVTLPDYGTYTVEVVASADGYKDLEANKEVTWTKPTPKDLTGEITIGDPDDNGGVAVAYTGNENVTLAVTVKDAQGNVVPATFENGVVTLPDYGTYTVEVVASADGYKDLEANKEVTWTKPTPKQLTGTITFSVTQGNKNNEAAGIVTATYDGPETGVTVKIEGDSTKVAAATSEGVRLPDYGTYQVKAIATAEGYADLDGEGEVTWEEPQTAAPEFNVSEDGLTVEATGEGTVTLYIVNADGSETALDNPTTFDQKEEAYTVNLKAVAHVDGAKDGVATKTITIPAKSSEPGTGVNELVDGKAVKSVRYFNMAGQEMQEVNGVTIVVTTYTDGTTSAVKVMK